MCVISSLFVATLLNQVDYTYSIDNFRKIPAITFPTWLYKSLNTCTLPYTMQLSNLEKNFLESCSTFFPKRVHDTQDSTTEVLTALKKPCENCHGFVQRNIAIGLAEKKIETCGDDVGFCNNGGTCFVANTLNAGKVKFCQCPPAFKGYRCEK